MSFVLLICKAGNQLEAKKKVIIFRLKVAKYRQKMDMEKSCISLHESLITFLILLTVVLNNSASIPLLCRFS